MRWDALSQAERNAAYNNALAVLDSPQLKQLRETASAAYRDAHPAGLDLAYGTDPRQKWDLFPSDRSGAPCLVFIHGGYWQMNSRELFASIAVGMAAHGWSVALPGYRLAPQAPLGDIVHDIRSALDWLATEGVAWGIGGPVVLAGWSAGAHLAAMTLDHPMVGAGLGISGIYDLERVSETYVNDKLRLSGDDVVRLSPMRLSVTPKRFDIAFGTAELPALVEESRNFRAYRADAGAPGELLPILGADHFTILDALSSPSGALVERILGLAREIA